MSSIKLFLLGSPRLERDGQPLELQYRKNVALLAYLAVTGERHTREALIALLWPELDPSRARANLRRNLSLLRQALGGDVLAVEGDSIGLDAEADLWLDVDAFRRLLSSQSSHGHLEAEICSDCLAALAEAAELHRDDFLAGFTLTDSLAYDDWQFFEAEELRRELASALERLVRGHSAQEQHDSAISYARRWLALDPLHEPVHRQLMGLYARTGQRAAALRQYEECARILEDELGLPPSRETASLYEGIRRGADLSGLANLTGLDAAPRHNLPVQVTPFVGREGLLEEIAECLQDPDCRLISLVGLGGSGKTRLALEAAGEQVGRYRDGVYLVALAPLRSADTIVPTVAGAIGLTLYGATDPWQQLLDHLRDKHMLLVLDNLEHVIEGIRGAVALIDAVLRIAPNVRILVTSRVRPNVGSEYLLPVWGLDVPPRPQWTPVAGQVPLSSGEEQAEDARRCSAVQLFLLHASRARRGFEPTAAELVQVAQICRLVQGMPLAILLAAAWMEMLSPAEIVAELERGYDLLQADLRDLPERQRSIEAVFDASWRMLDDAERDVFAQLSVFRGGFTRRAAEEVTGAGLRTLFSLVHKSFLQRDATGRYDIHELLRQYAEHKLAEVPEAWQGASDLHCDHYLEVLHQVVLDGDRGSGWQGLLIEIDNIRAGWHWAVSQARFGRICRYAPDLVDALCWGAGFEKPAEIFGWAAEVLRTQNALAGCREAGVALGMILALEGGGDSETDSTETMERRMELVQEGASILRRLGARREFVRCVGVGGWGPEYPTVATELLREKLLYCQELGVPGAMTWVLSGLGELAICRGALDEAEQYHRQQLSIRQEFDRTLRRDAQLHGLGGKIAYHRGDYAVARRHYEESLAGFTRANRKAAMAAVASYLGDTALAMKDYRKARECHQQALALFREMSGHWQTSMSGDHFGAAYSLDRLGDVALALGETGRARAHYRQALQIARDHPVVALDLDVVVSHAALLARDGEHERAVSLAALVLHHPARHIDVKRRARTLLDRLEAQLPPGVFAAARERGQAQELETAMGELFAEFGSDG